MLIFHSYVKLPEGMSAIVDDIAMSPPQADIGMLASQGNIGNLCGFKLGSYHLSKQVIFHLLHLMKRQGIGDEDGMIWWVNTDENWWKRDWDWSIKVSKRHRIFTGRLPWITPGIPEIPQMDDVATEWMRGTFHCQMIEIRRGEKCQLGLQTIMGSSGVALQPPFSM